MKEDIIKELEKYGFEPYEKDEKIKLECNRQFGIDDHLIQDLNTIRGLDVKKEIVEMVIIYINFNIRSLHYDIQVYPKNKTRNIVLTFTGFDIVI